MLTGRGIIPAYAGSTLRNVIIDAQKADHPRIRGEHHRRSHRTERRLGSSPHTRGALAMPVHTRRGWGIIPAYAGSTTPSWKVTGKPADHPRIRGEHHCTSIVIRPGSGSSPHTRGARVRDQHTPRRLGIIPAYAGSTPSSGRARAPRRDHPRIRGEHVEEIEEIVRDSGSSPHTRGARRAAPAEGKLHGIIPAYAGSTAARAASPGRARDHPRIRGEHLLAVV